MGVQVVDPVAAVEKVVSYEDRARTKAEREAIEARSRAEVERMAAQSQAAVQGIRAEADAAALRVQAEASTAHADNPALLRLRELETLSQLSSNPAARIYIGFDKHRNSSPYDSE